VTPLRDIFGAVFFISVGMTLDPALLAQHWIALTMLVLAVILGELLGGAMASLPFGVGGYTFVEAGMSLTPIGGVSFLIDGAWRFDARNSGLSLHAGRGRLRHHDLYHSLHDQSLGSGRPLRRRPCAVPLGSDAGYVRFADGTDSAGSHPIWCRILADSHARWGRGRHWANRHSQRRRLPGAHAASPRPNPPPFHQKRDRGRPLSPADVGLLFGPVVHPAP